jgi:hypothetical protein
MDREQPSLITLRDSQVPLLALSNLDLRACRFLDAHGLEALRIEASCLWPRSQANWRGADRDMIAEEQLWRGENGLLSRWDPTSARPPQWLQERDGPSVLEPEQIASVYRALRKSREDDKDEAGASDLYYGEMEMRRHSWGRDRRIRSRPRADRGILTAYWFISGYGLKASRALIALVFVIGVASYGLHNWGFRPDPPYARALLYSIESTSSLFRTPESGGVNLTYAGEAMQSALRLLGPILIGLAFLAIRARVKR